MNTKIKQHWLIIEADLTGHHEVYLSNLVQGALQAGYELTVAVSDSKSNDAALERLSGFFNDIQFIKFLMPSGCREFGGAAKDIKREFSFWKFFKKVFEEINSVHPVDHVFLPFFDYALNAMAIAGSPFLGARVSGIVMRPTFHFKAMGVRAPYRKLDEIKKYLFELLISNNNIADIYSIDDTLVEYAGRQRSASWKKVKILHDPASLSGNVTRQTARIAFNLKPDASVVLVYGAIDLRKGVANLLAAMSNELALNSTAVVVVAGKFSDEVRVLMRSSAVMRLIESGRVLPIDRRISDEEEQSLLSAADAVWVGYVGHYTMSGVVVKALMANRTLLACRDGLIGWHSERVANAIVFDPRDEKAVLSALLNFSNKSEITERVEMNDYSWESALFRIFGV